MSPEIVGLDNVAAGRAFPPTPLDLSKDAIIRLLDSLEATLPVDVGGDELVPPSALASLALGALLSHVGLPAGTLHASQEILMGQAVPIGAKALCEASVSAVSARGSMTFVTLDFTVRRGEPVSTIGGNADEILATGSGTVMFPGGDV